MRSHLMLLTFQLKAPPIVSGRIRFRTSFRSTQKQSDDTALDTVILLTLNILIIRIHLLKHTGLEVEARPNWRILDGNITRLSSLLPLALLPLRVPPPPSSHPLPHPC